MNSPSKTVRIYLQWKSVTPDRRQWKPSMPVLEPIKIMVGMDVPNEMAKVTDDEDTILTLDGMRYVIDQLEAFMGDSQSKVDDDDIEWEADTIGTKTDDEDWEVIDEEKSNDEDDWS